jgi:adenine-specific DNA-methyltransferase
MSHLTPRQRLGDIPGVAGATLPRNTILHGDCVELMKALPGSSVDMILTDPPYLVNYRDRTGRTVANDNSPHWVAPAFAEMHRVLRDDSFCISFYGWQAADIFMTAWKDAGFRVVGHMVFAKTYGSSARYLTARHESAYLLAKGSPALPQNPLPDVLPWNYTGNRLHPTQKPVEALKPLVSAFCAPGRLVLVNNHTASGAR